MTRYATPPVIQVLEHPDAAPMVFAQWFASLAVLMRAQTIVEAGTFLGHIPLATSVGLRVAQIPHHIWSADIYDHGAAAEVAKANFSDTITVCQQDFTEMLAERIGEQSIDLAFIDSGPARDFRDIPPNTRWNHYQAVWPYMKHGGLIVVDDTQHEANWAHVDEIRKAGTTLYHARACTLIEVP